MKRASYVNVTGRNSLRGSVIGTSARRDLLQMQAAQDKEIFDPMLGCPLSSFENATLGLVGGKALNCWRLAKHGFPVPTAFIIPTYSYSMHIADAGLAKMIDDIYTSDLKDDKAREVAKASLVTIRERIQSTPLNAEVIANLESFLASLPTGSFVSVRSSGSAEDLASKSFAGQYDTFLYKITREEIIESIKLCWVSMFKDHILDYATRSDDYSPGSLKTPTMGVLVMQMIEAKTSGVCFSRNLWGDKNEVMIEAVLGQGEGLVSGVVTPSRYVLDKYSTRMCYSDETAQTKKYVRGNTIDGVELVDLEKPHEGPTVKEKDLVRVTNLARAIEDFYNAPQDIEWAMNSDGSIYILQSRPITTVGNSSTLSFLPPGEGFYTFDPTHFPRPLSPWMQQYSFEYATHNSRRIGCLIKTINFRCIHGFAFTQPELFPPTDFEKLERAASAYWEKKLYEDDYREFTDFFRPDCERLQQELRVVDPAALSHASLVGYVGKCFDYALKFWKLHHSYTMPTMAVVGGMFVGHFVIFADFMNRMSDLTGKSTMETLKLLESASPESRGILNKQDITLGKMYNLIKRNDKAVELLKCEEHMASWALDCLLHMPGELGEVFRQVSIEYGWRLAGGYDLVVPAMIETPNFFLKTILQGVEEDVDAAEASEERAEKLAAEWREELPEDKREEYDEILDMGRRFFRIRDERGLCTDLSGVGLCRRGIMEAGRRLKDASVINEAEHITVATKAEALSLLTGDLRNLSMDKMGPVDVPTSNVLESRFLYIKNADPNSVPRALGTPPPPPPDAPLPPGIGRTMRNMDTGLLKGIWDETPGNDEDVTENPDKVVGLTASSGTVTAPVTLVLQDSDLQYVKKGDIIVTYSSSASFNMVLGLCNGIVTNYGGMLSHAAIVAREYGIPAIVGSQTATDKFKTGDIVTIDSATSSVTRVKQ
ncbi:MAG: hypothetical protein SGARI_000216 [Bacillariaceae sp.]